MCVCTHNVLLVNEISCSRGKNDSCIDSHLFETHLDDARVLVHVDARTHLRKIRERVVCSVL